MTASAPRRSPFERHPWITLGLLGLVGVLGTDVVFTRVYRSVRPPASNGPEFRIRNPVYDHGFRPFASVDREYWGPWVASYRINSLGFRDRVVREVPLESPRRRLLFIGDSFVEGMGFDYERSFVGQVDAALAPGVEVLNAGVASYCPIIYERKVRYLLDDVGLRFQDLVVFIDIGDILDEVTYKLDAAGNVVPRQARRHKEGPLNRVYGDPLFGRFGPLESFLRWNTLICFPVYDWVHHLARTRGSRAALWTVDPELMREYGQEGLDLASRHMDELLATLRRHDVSLTLAVYPWPDQVLIGDLDSAQARYWRGWTSARGVGFIDYFPAFVDRARPREAVRRYFIPGDIHWSAEGHRAVAEGFLASYAWRPQ